MPDPHGGISDPESPHEMHPATAGCYAHVAGGRAPTPVRITAFHTQLPHSPAGDHDFGLDRALPDPKPRHAHRGPAPQAQLARLTGMDVDQAH